MSGRIARHLVRPMLVLVAAGCSDSAPAEHAAPVPDRTESLVLEAEVGTESGTEFASVADAAMADDGSMYVLDPRTRQVTMFDSAGAFIRAIGREGEGPGEFRSPVAIAIDGDSLMVWDIGVWRLSVFTARGEPLGTVPIPPRPQSGWPAVVRYRGDGEWLYLDQEIASPEQEGVELASGIIRGTARLLSWRPESDWQEVAQFPGMEAALVEEGGELGLSNAPFPAGPLWAAGDERSIWYADSRSTTLVQLNSAGDTTAVVTVDTRAPAVTDSAWAAFVGGRDGDMATPAARQRSGLPRPETQPALETMVSGTNGDLWVQLRDDGSSATSEWHVYAGDGSPRFSVLLPRRFRIRGVSGDRIIGDIRDSLDVPTVRKYRMNQP